MNMDIPESFGSCGSGAPVLMEGINIFSPAPKIEHVKKV
jgi:hypothetical protein